MCRTWFILWLEWGRVEEANNDFASKRLSQNSTTECFCHMAKCLIFVATNDLNRCHPYITDLPRNWKIRNVALTSEQYIFLLKLYLSWLIDGIPITSYFIHDSDYAQFKTIHWEKKTYRWNHHSLLFHSW